MVQTNYNKVPPIGKQPNQNGFNLPKDFNPFDDDDLPIDDIPSEDDNDEVSSKLARETILQFMSGKWPYSIVKGVSDFSMTGEFGIWGPTVKEIADKWEWLPNDKKHAIKGWIEDLCKGRKDLQELLENTVDEDVPVQGGGDEEVKGEAPPLNFALPPVDISNSLFAKVKAEFLNFARQLSPESYEPFLEAVFWWTCSAIVMRRIAIDFAEPMYTNLYIALCAKSTVWKKSSALVPAERILKGLSLLHIRHKGSETPESFVYQASGGTIPKNWDELDETEQESIKRKIATAGLEGLFIDELGQYLMDTRNATNTLWRRIILEWHACPEDWEKKTKGGGAETVDKAYLSMIGCIVPDNLSGKDMEAITKDGSIARIRALTPPNGTVAEVITFEQGYLQTPPELLKAFSEWHQRLKPPIVDITLEERELEDKQAKDGRKIITKWVKEWVQPLEETLIRLTPETYQQYHNYRVAIRACIQENNLPSTIAANYERLPLDLVKMAAMAASFEGKYYIDLTHLAMAYDFIEETRKGIYRLMFQAGYREDTDSGESYEEKKAAKEKVVLHEIREYFKVSGRKDFSVAQLTNKRPKLEKFGPTELPNIINDLAKADFLVKEISIHPRNKKKTTKYSLNT